MRKRGSKRPRGMTWGRTRSRQCSRHERCGSPTARVRVASGVVHVYKFACVYVSMPCLSRACVCAPVPPSTATASTGPRGVPGAESGPSINSPVHTTVSPPWIRGLLDRVWDLCTDP